MTPPLSKPFRCIDRLSIVYILNIAVYTVKLFIGDAL